MAPPKDLVANILLVELVSCCLPVLQCLHHLSKASTDSFCKGPWMTEISTLENYASTMRSHCMRCRSLIWFRACRGRNVASVHEDVKLDVVFKEFMTSANHMLLVRRTVDMPLGSVGDVVGVITLEDVMEEVIGVRSLAPCTPCIPLEEGNWGLNSQIRCWIERSTAQSQLCGGHVICPLCVLHMLVSYPSGNGIAIGAAPFLLNGAFGALLNLAHGSACFTKKSFISAPIACC